MLNLLEYVYSEEISFEGGTNEIPLHIDLIKFALRNEQVELARYVVTHLVTRVLSFDNVHTLSAFFKDISSSSYQSKDLSTLLTNAYKSCMKFLAQNWTYFKKTKYWSNLRGDIGQELTTLHAKPKATAATKGLAAQSKFKTPYSGV